MLEPGRDPRPPAPRPSRRGPRLCLARGRRLCRAAPALPDPHGELDVPWPSDRGVLVFVEVRAKGSGRFGDPGGSVTPQKQRRVAAMAEAFLGLERQHERVCRFDVVGVDAAAEPPRVTIYRDAFRPGWG
ncbi:MAG: YraN family protein [Vicinamibacterales bacterium]